MPRPRPGAHLHPRVKAQDLIQDLIRGRLAAKAIILHERAKVHHLVGHWRFLDCVDNRNPTLPENRQ